MLHGAAFGNAIEINCARLKTVRPSEFGARFEPDRGNLSSVGWSGARDLNQGPHGPEPCRCGVLQCPTDSRVVLANTKSTSLVSYGDPYSRPVPRMRDTAVIRQVTKFGLADGFTGERIKL